MTLKLYCDIIFSARIGFDMENEQQITLDKLEKGKDAYILSIDCEDKALRKHILDMGLTPGVEVTLIKTAPMGDPLELRVRGSELTL